MLSIVVLGDEVFDEETGEFSTVGDIELDLEHSLVSLSKWESKFEKPFLTDKDKTEEELQSYIEAMIVTPDYPRDILKKLSVENVSAINDYIQAKMTATWFYDDLTAPKNREIITSELIYYWLTAFNIPFECEHWHLNRLFTLIRICNAKNSKPKKMSPAEALAKQRELNAQRRQELGSSG